MKKVLFFIGMVALIFAVGACTRTSFEGDILGTWDFNVIGNRFELEITEQGLVTFEASAEAPVEFISGGTSSTKMVGIEIRIDGIAYTLHGNIYSDESMSGFVRAGLNVEAGIVVGVWSATKQ